MNKEIGRGAEAIITLEDNPKRVLKNRISKGYRIKEIDDELRKIRTRKEAKILQKLKGFTPKLISTDNLSKIEMEYIEGSLIKDIIDKQPLLGNEIGKQAGIMHDEDIIHGDLTTGNMILQKSEPGKQNTKRVLFIDFGLSINSTNVEDRAVDLHLFLESLESKHYKNKQRIWKEFLKGYNPKNKDEILKRLEIVELRGRNKAKY